MNFTIKEPYRELDELEVHYKEKLIWALNETDVPDEITEIVENGILAQCIEKRYKKRYYKPFWFVSDTGFVLTVCDKGRNSGSPVSLVNPYVCRKYYYIDNKNGTGRCIFHHVLVALYHDPNVSKYINYTKDLEVHHIRPFDSSLPYWVNNNIQNLQMLPKYNVYGFTGHKTLHSQPINSMETLNIAKSKKVRGANLPIIVLKDEDGHKITFTVPEGISPYEFALSKGFKLE